ncbi:MAG: hypothetical protein ACTSP4_14825 [Candidatus Hodarchaeales archaeon]
MIMDTRLDCIPCLMKQALKVSMESNATCIIRKDANSRSKYQERERECKRPVQGVKGTIKRTASSKNTRPAK